jgi:hypothetical protein
VFISSSILSIIIFIAFRIWCIVCVIFGHHERKHEQGKGRIDVERPIFRKVEPYSKQEITLDKGNQQKKYVVSISSEKIIFTKMDKLHRWIAGRDEAWAKYIGVGSLSLELTPIRPLVKEFIQVVV